MVVKCTFFIVSAAYPNYVLDIGTAMEFSLIASWKACIDVYFCGAFGVDILGISLLDITKYTLMLSIYVWLIMFR